jgi:hypothetical protein
VEDVGEPDGSRGADSEGAVLDGDIVPRW